MLLRTFCATEHTSVHANRCPGRNLSRKFYAGIRVIRIPIIYVLDHVFSKKIVIYLLLILLLLLLLIILYC